MSTQYIHFRPSDELVSEFRRYYHGDLLDRLVHWCFRSLLTHDEAREVLIERTHEALLARCWPWTGDINNPLMGYPEGDDVCLPWETEEEGMLKVFDWALRGLLRGQERDEDRARVARRLLGELASALASGGVLRSDGAEFSMADGVMIARVTANNWAEFVPVTATDNTEG